MTLELEMIWKSGHGLAEDLSPHLTEGVEEYHYKPQLGYPTFRPRFEPSTFRMQVQNKMNNHRRINLGTYTQTKTFQAQNFRKESSFSLRFCPLLCTYFLFLLPSPTSSSTPLLHFCLLVLYFFLHLLFSFHSVFPFS
jgi:hypothetical protein